MLNEEKDRPSLLDDVLDTWLHLPTMIALSIITVILMWQLYAVSLSVGEGFVRLDSNRGNLTLFWHNGCCQLDYTP